jgi:hypothetical protein
MSSLLPLPLLLIVVVVVCIPAQLCQPLLPLLQRLCRPLL